jgi:hypothetical protein
MLLWRAMSSYNRCGSRLFGGVILPALMWLMVLHHTLNTAVLLSAIVFGVVFRLLYAAVCSHLGHFVGLFISEELDYSRIRTGSV